MSTLIARPAVAPARSPAVAYDRLRLLAAVPFLLGILVALLGFAWDVQWHSDVGPDTFFTAPHLVLYTGIALAGLTTLAVVLLTTFRYRGLATGTVSVLGGRFRGPAGYVIGGIGAAMFLLYGLADQWWHNLYGFDVTLVSPPHVGLILSILISMVGCLCTFAAEVRRAADQGRSWIVPALGFAAAAGLLVAFISPSAIDVMLSVAAGLGIEPEPNGTIALLYATTLLTAAAVLRRPGAATLVAVVFTVLRLGLWDAVPWITGEHAASLGLFIRDNTRGAPIISGMIPAYVLLAAIVVDLVLWTGRRFAWNVWLTVIAAGALVPAVIQLTEPMPALFTRMPMLWPPVALDRLPQVSLITIAIGAVGGGLGWMTGHVLLPQERPAATGAANSAAILPRPAVVRETS